MRYSATELPHLKRVIAKGRAYTYFRTGHRDRRGKEVLKRLPDPSWPDFRFDYDCALAEREGNPPPKWVRPNRSQVYFIGGEIGAIKIGWAKDPTARLKEHQCGSPIKLCILATVTGTLNDEREYHKRFKAHRLHGEWFDRHPDILAEIERLNSLPPSPLNRRDVL